MTIEHSFVNKRRSAWNSEHTRPATSPKGGTQLIVHIGRRLGAGAFGAVHEAELNGQDGYVIKIPALRLESLSKEEAELRGYDSLHNEEKMYEFIGKHPNVINCLAKTPRGSLVMPRMKESMREHILSIKAERNSETRVTRVTEMHRDMFKAFLILKENSIAHNDAHQDNWMADNNGTFKLIDFGVASFYQGEGLTDTKKYQESFGVTDQIQQFFFKAHPFVVMRKNFINTGTGTSDKADKILYRLWPIFLQDMYDFIIKRPGMPDTSLPPENAEKFISANAFVLAQAGREIGLSFKDLRDHLLRYHHNDPALPRLQQGDTVRILQKTLSDKKLFPQPARSAVNSSERQARRRSV